MSMSDIARAIDGYFAVWNESDAAQRRALIDRTWSEDASYVDPLMAADGLEGIDTMVGGVQAQYPGYTFRLAGSIDSHHDRARFGWEMVGPGASEPVVVGLDVAVITDDGRLRSVTGFIDHAPGMVATG